LTDAKKPIYKYGDVVWVYAKRKIYKATVARNAFEEDREVRVNLDETASPSWIVARNSVSKRKAELVDDVAGRLKTTIKQAEQALARDKEALAYLECVKQSD
jgi:hypothetical protein